MVRARTGETRAHPFRTERLYTSNSSWYFMVRGGASEGPFDSRETAQIALDRFVTRQIERSRAQLSARPFSS